MPSNKRANDKDSIISELLDDLTHLEINTLLKSGMTAAQPPDDIEEVLYRLIERYAIKLNVILDRNDIGFSTRQDTFESVQQLHIHILALCDHMDNNKLRLAEDDYIIFLRMKSFCIYIQSKDNVVIKDRAGTPLGETLYTVNLNRYDSYTFVLDVRERAKLKRMYDLGTENVILQTRFGIDGDVVTRIEESFASRPRQTILDVHDKHTTLSLQYWDKLVNVVVDVVSGIFKRK
jgi:hypothetical protein